MNSFECSSSEQIEDYNRTVRATPESPSVPNTELSRHIGTVRLLESIKIFNARSEALKIGCTSCRGVGVDVASGKLYCSRNPLPPSIRS